MLWFASLFNTGSTADWRNRNTLKSYSAGLRAIHQLLWLVDKVSFRAVCERSMPLCVCDCVCLSLSFRLLHVQPCLRVHDRTRVWSLAASNSAAALKLSKGICKTSPNSNHLQPALHIPNLSLCKAPDDCFTVFSCICVVHSE